MCPADSETIWRLPKNVCFTGVHPSILLPQPPNAQGHPVREEVGVSVGGVPEVKFCGCWEMRVREKATGLEDSQIWRCHTPHAAHKAGTELASLDTGSQKPLTRHMVPRSHTSPSSTKHLKVSVPPRPVSVNHIRTHIVTVAYMSCAVLMQPNDSPAVELQGPRTVGPTSCFHLRVCMQKTYPALLETRGIYLWKLRMREEETKLKKGEEIIIICDSQVASTAVKNYGQNPTSLTLLEL